VAEYTATIIIVIIITGPGNGSLIATNVVLVLVVVLGVLVIRFSITQVLFRFSTDRNETFHTY